MTCLIEINNLSKSYKDVVLNNINMKVRDEVLLLYGTNGSGKSTLIKCILGLVNYNGEILINGTIGYIPEVFQLPELVKVEKFLKDIASLTNSNYTRLVKKYGLSNKMDDYIYSLSKGMKQKLVIIQALIHSPDILVCDEPINGLDKEMQDIFCMMLKEQKKLGKAIIIASHYEKLYTEFLDRVIYLDKTN
ncbi:ABC transporter ATP-binding protein [Mycoplasmatota bacterium]|nr:ABC transporter ATP-binding protein [Mycoplasmatota bacterium]